MTGATDNSEADTGPEKTRGISPDGAIRFLATMGADMRCQCCKNDTFHVLSDGDLAPTDRLQQWNTDGRPNGRFLDLLAVACSQCGYLIYFLSDIVERWIRDNPEVVDDAGKE